MNLSDTSTPERLVAGFGPLPPVAQMLSRLQHLLADPNSGLDDISNLIRLDAALTTRVIQISNSAWFGRGGARCTTILEAVNRVGFRQVYHLVAVLVSNSLVARRLPAYGHEAAAMWQESVACAFAGEMLANRLGEDTSVAYMSGLLHFIGRIPINHFLVASSPNIKPLANDGFPRDFSGAEYALFGFTQADVSAVMLRKWEFSRATIEPIRSQYDPLDAPEPYDRFAAILYVARLLRTAVCQEGPAPESSEDEEIFSSLHLSRDEILGFAPELKESLSRAMKITTT